MKNQFQQPRIQLLPSFSQNDIAVDVLRLDEVHPIISGNKLFKLQYYLQDAIANHHQTIVTFGGAFSNHIVATAAACNLHNLNSIGIIRGEAPQQLSHTLQQAKAFGMELYFVSRAAYKNKATIAANFAHKNVYQIAEGGFGNLGAKGAAGILKTVDTTSYTHIICACGTGTTLAGLVQSAQPHQQIIGINVLKGYENLKNDVVKIIDKNIATNNFIIHNDYHFGGYAKHTKHLINWMNALWQNENLPTDFVYTAKLFFAVKDLLAKKYFNNDSKILVIHSGGLQGNLSLEKGELLFTT
jgi:1-aminocyclopropane-1-carboxylate deaminase